MRYVLPFVGRGKGDDPHYQNVVLLLHADGANGSTAIVDNSVSPKTLAVVGSASISTAQSKFGGASLRLLGSSGYVSSANIPDARLDSGDFTIELFFRADNASTGTQQSLIAQTDANTPNGWGVFIGGSGQIYIQGNTGSPNFVQTANGIVSSNVWHHLAITRSGSTTRIFLNGNVEASGSMGWSPNTNRDLTLGYEAYRSLYGFTGYVDEVRITKNVARYTANFTPPTGPFPNN